MITSKKLHQFLNELLCNSTAPIKDYCPNGLQVQGKETISKIVTGVTVSLDFLEQAVKLSADAVFVHHGLFWNNGSSVVTGPQYHRLRLVLQHEINVFAYHLPLDIHPTLGNNAQLAKHLDFEITGCSTLLGVAGLGYTGTLKKPMDSSEFAFLVGKKLQRAPLHISAGNHKIQTLAWCTGAAQDGIEWAAHCGVDAYLSGEISERTTYLARELGVHYFACGHHATERYGVQAVGALLAKEYDIEHVFVDIDNPV